MIVRRYRKDDIPVMLEHIRTHVGESVYGKFHFSNEKMTDLLVGNVNNLTFFCSLAVDDAGTIIGGMCASTAYLIFNYDLVANDHFLYVLPEHRDTEAATGLVAEYAEWAKNRKVKLAYLTNTTGLRPEVFARWASKFGFKLVGSTHSMEV